MQSRIQEKTAEEREIAERKRAFVCQRTKQIMEAVQQASTNDPIETIVKRVRNGPFMLLRRAYQSGWEVDVMTRHARGIKGTMRARLCGFDKFMNLLLADVRETLVVRQHVIRAKLHEGRRVEEMVDRAEAALRDALRKDEEASATMCDQSAGSKVVTRDASDINPSKADNERETLQERRVWKQVLRQRNLSRVLLRGDQVVMISLAAGPQKLPSSLSHLGGFKYSTPSDCNG
jgi:small nuclear ribonucleoprotein (snRNP)-like protein